MRHSVTAATGLYGRVRHHCDKVVSLSARQIGPRSAGVHRLHRISSLAPLCRYPYCTYERVKRPCPNSASPATQDQASAWRWKIGVPYSTVDSNKIQPHSEMPELPTGLQATISPRIAFLFPSVRAHICMYLYMPAFSFKQRPTCNVSLHMLPTLSQSLHLTANLHPMRDKHVAVRSDELTTQCGSVDVQSTLITDCGERLRILEFGSATQSNRMPSTKSADVIGWVSGRNETSPS